MTLKDDAEELASGERILRADVGSPELRIHLLELTLADSINLTQSITTMLLEHDTYLKTLVTQTSDYRVNQLRNQISLQDERIKTLEERLKNRTPTSIILKYTED